MNGESLKNLVDAVNSKGNSSGRIEINRGEEVPNRQKTIKRIKEIQDEGGKNPSENSEVLELLGAYSDYLKTKLEEENPNTVEVEFNLHMADIYFEVGLEEKSRECIQKAKMEAEENNNQELKERIAEIEILMQASNQMYTGGPI